jgi:hypothetical protein
MTTEFDPGPVSRDEDRVAADRLDRSVQPNRPLVVRANAGREDQYDREDARQHAGMIDAAGRQMDGR